MTLNSCNEVRCAHTPDVTSLMNLAKLVEKFKLTSTKLSLHVDHTAQKWVDVVFGDERVCY